MYLQGPNTVDVQHTRTHSSNTPSVWCQPLLLHTYTHTGFEVEHPKRGATLQSSSLGATV